MARSTSKSGSKTKRKSAPAAKPRGARKKTARKTAAKSKAKPRSRKVAAAEYVPARRMKPKPSTDPLEISLVYNVTACGTCDFFWPDKVGRQPYGPYPTFDFATDYPDVAESKNRPSYPWVPVHTQAPGFPNGEIMDGCRKAPIMTIGINPNLTAFSPGRTGAAWSYPGFTSENGTDLYTKYAWYYRYRSVYQERFDLPAIEKYLLPDGQVKAARNGRVISAERKSSSPSFDLVVRYDGDAKDTKLALEGALGEPRWVVLFDRYGPTSQFKKGDTLAARLEVPGGKELELWQQQVGYYEQFEPSLAQFEDFLAKQGHKTTLRMGEDVCQLDMVACASPHWTPDFLGGAKSENTIISNCVSRNAWAIKQLVQTQPAVLFLVGQSTYSMFRNAFGAYIRRDPPLSTHPADGAFTLFRETTDPGRRCTLEFSTEIDGRKYSLSTRLVITPHFSYDTNFLPQIRLAKRQWAELQKDDASCAKFLKTDERIQFEDSDWGDVAFLIHKEPAAVLEEIDRDYPTSAKELHAAYYSAHDEMTTVLEDLYRRGKLSWQAGRPGKPGWLARNAGPCRFCVNDHWRFPEGCPYGKPDEAELPQGFLDKVAAAFVKGGKPRDAEEHAKALSESSHPAPRSQR
jgi:hypothetical protein